VRRWRANLRSAHPHTVPTALTSDSHSPPLRPLLCVLSVDVMLFHWLDGVEAALPEAYHRLPTPLLHSFKKRAEQCPAIAKRLKSRTEKYTGVAPGF
jgi:hypothetical protein